MSKRHRRKSCSWPASFPTMAPSRSAARAATNMSEPLAAVTEDVSRWEPPKVEGASQPRGSGGVNVMHLAAVEREAWEHGYKAGHVEGVRKGEAELKVRIAEVDVKIAALQAIIETFAQPLAELDTEIESELTRLAMIIAKH